MIGRDDPIACRRCDAVFPAAERSCPECGTADRGYVGSAVVIVLGVGLLATSVSPLEFFYAVIGLILLVVGISAARDRRARLEDGRDRR